MSNVGMAERVHVIMEGRDVDLATALSAALGEECDFITDVMGRTNLSSPRHGQLYTRRETMRDLQEVLVYFKEDRDNG